MTDKVKVNKISGVIYTLIGMISLIAFVYYYKHEYIIYSIVVTFFGIFVYYRVDKVEYDLNAGMNENEGFWNKY